MGMITVGVRSSPKAKTLPWLTMRSTPTGKGLSAITRKLTVKTSVAATVPTLIPPSSKGKAVPVSLSATGVGPLPLSKVALLVT